MRKTRTKTEIVAAEDLKAGDVLVCSNEWRMPVLRVVVGKERVSIRTGGVVGAGEMNAHLAQRGRIPCLKTTRFVREVPDRATTRDAVAVRDED